MKKLTRKLLAEFLADDSGSVYFGAITMYYWYYGTCGVSLYKLIGHDYELIAHCNNFRTMTLKEINIELSDSFENDVI